MPVASINETAVDEGKRSDEGQQSDPSATGDTSKPSKFYRTTRRISSVSVEDQANSTQVKQEIKKRMLNSFLARARKTAAESPPSATSDLPLPPTIESESVNPADEFEGEMSTSVTQSLDSQTGKNQGDKSCIEEDVEGKELRMLLLPDSLIVGYLRGTR